MKQAKDIFTDKKGLQRHLTRSAGFNALSITPPDYRIDVLDNNLALQRKADSSAAGIATEGRRSNRTGLPDALKAGVEHLSGLSLDDVLQGIRREYAKEGKSGG